MSIILKFRRFLSRILITQLCLMPVSAAVLAGEWSGYVAGEYRGFTHTALDPAQHEHYFSLSAEPEYLHQWDNGKQTFTFTPFVRWDQFDSERSHADVRELTWVKAARAHEWRIGMRKVFWGVTEFLHLVDVINQTDLVENIDGEDKLGQPMINLAIIRNWGTVDIFVLPGFRERTFPGEEGRLRTIPRVDSDQPIYESRHDNDHVDGALRWSHTLGPWDLGVYYFAGTSRDPLLLLGMDDNGGPVLIPRYDLIEQTGLDVQATFDKWLWKLEAIHRSGQGESYDAATGGFEYTFYGIFKTGADLGVLMEYMYDDRGTNATTLFQDDLGVGVRLTLNDAQSSEALFGIITDRDHHSRLVNLEASRRIGDSWKLSLEARFFSEVPVNDTNLFSLRNDDHVQIELARYF